MVVMNTTKVNLSEVSGSLYEIPPIQSLQLDLKVVLGIVQAEGEKISDEGYLFGTHIGPTLEITNSTPLPAERVRKEYEMDRQREIADRDHLAEKQMFQSELSEWFKQSQMDSKVVGWYYIAWPDAVTTKDVIEAQLAFEREHPHFVLLAYDPWKSAAGKLGLRALRLTAKCRQFFQMEALGRPTEAGGSLDGEIYEEIPLSIHIPLLSQVFLHDTDFEQNSIRDETVYAQENEQEIFLKRQINNISNSLDALQVDVSDCVGLRPNRRYQKELSDVKHDAKRNGLIHSRTLAEDTNFLQGLIKQMQGNVSLLGELCEEKSCV
ncbi:Mov34/MPN/PAD-1 family protein [Perkinsela sp. CCAP 1560/4]|nr:Mov34/MPN/PAD-1 family protein [Perkinsela sp. CCAP 1560/4]|eukprot:KNH08988.1 Mov34/MPN/PAD-1 family protein [Perkinsela sp. CCAP 1560/4]